MSREGFIIFNCEGVEKPVIFVEPTEVVAGVDCDVYRFPDDKTRDLGVIYIKAGFKTRPQRVLKGDRTIEGLYFGKGTLTITKINGDKEVYEVDSESGHTFSKEVKIGEIMQWRAADDSVLIASEICYPPYEAGRYEDLTEE